ncbi:hypothetical protein PPL_06458 [Heterostelium album PN500]|uniref:Ankyrin repeat protein n=1 Tax=Heterostelium pallidum (strain ATCC 26659 / Pp 5 / PN500) TaxID=670386 RepID=D3BD77_HETP5|nr:hypothetical protein PPL_06458 [Heterostelium album PN500]EFA80869.1 hypothetical protein PPL_06458 [Heterostelium album PN500]|eukprot:XP_020432988.1 hypothetical protein PPL_06458 [Heterostelium album PN500]
MEKMLVLCENGNSELLKYVVQSKIGGDKLDMSLCIDRAAEFGNLDAVKYLSENRKEECTTEAMDISAKGCTKKAMQLACENGHLQVAEFLHKYRFEGLDRFASINNSIGGFLKIVQFVQSNNRTIHYKNTFDNVAKKGHLDILKFLHYQRKEECSTNAIDWSAAKGHFSVVEFLLNNRTEGFTEDALIQSARNGHLSIFEFLYKHRKSSFSIYRAMETAIQHQQTQINKSKFYRI